MTGQTQETKKSDRMRMRLKISGKYEQSEDLIETLLNTSNTYSDP
jgi:hypothetical protein